MNKTKTSHKNYKKWLLGGTILLIIIVGGLALINFRKSDDKANDPLPSKSKVDLAAPTAQDKRSGDDAKARIIDDEAKRNVTPVTNSDGKKSVTPVISYADQSTGQVEVGAFINGIFETNGVCTLTLTKGSDSKSVAVDAVQDANSVDCPVMAMPRSSIESGSWSAVVTYVSSMSNGASAVRIIEVK